jgi:hypothetical protein
MSKDEENKLKRRGVDRVVTSCCGKEFLWMKPSPNSYGKDMPKYCPYCGCKEPTLTVG